MQKKKLVDMIAKELLAYESKKADKVKKWDDLPHWEKIRYIIKAEKTLEVIRNVAKKIKKEQRQ